MALSIVSPELIHVVKTECHNDTCQALSLTGFILQFAFGIEAATCGTVQSYHSETNCGFPRASTTVVVLASNYKTDSNAYNLLPGTSHLLQYLFIGDLQ